MSSLLRELTDPAAYPHETGEIQFVETHISWVILTGPFAYKIKKPVKLGFLDFSTLEHRRYFCEEELRVNRRTAPDLYLCIVPIGMAADGLRVGAEPAIEYAVKMRQFPHEARLDRCLQAGKFGGPEACELATEVARFHKNLPPRETLDSEFEHERTIRPARNNFKHLEPQYFSKNLQQKLAEIENWTLMQADVLKEPIVSRALCGSIRECHGDLHLENLLQFDSRFVLFDAIEFNPELRWIDTANDIAFLAMDLMSRDRTDLAFIVLNTWLENSGDYDSLAVMRFYLVYRSMVRAVVTSIRDHQQTAQSGQTFRQNAACYIELAARLVETPPPQLLLMHGFSGSGKTWRSSRLVGELPALRVRSDLERKRLPGAGPAQSGKKRINSGLYSREITTSTYETLARHCETGLREGFSMIADATFLQRSHRELFIEMAGQLGVRVGIVDCSADKETLKERIRFRAATSKDASDADLAVLEHQVMHHDPLIEAEKALVVEPLSI